MPCDHCPAVHRIIHTGSWSLVHCFPHEVCVCVYAARVAVRCLTHCIRMLRPLRCCSCAPVSSRKALSRRWFFFDCQWPDEILLPTSACLASARAWHWSLCVICPRACVPMLSPCLPSVYHVCAPRGPPDPLSCAPPPPPAPSRMPRDLKRVQASLEQERTAPRAEPVSPLHVRQESFHIGSVGHSGGLSVGRVVPDKAHPAKPLDPKTGPLVGPVYAKTDPSFSAKADPSFSAAQSPGPAAPWPRLDPLQTAPTPAHIAPGPAAWLAPPPAASWGRHGSHSARSSARSGGRDPEAAPRVPVPRLLDMARHQLRRQRMLLGLQFVLEAGWSGHVDGSGAPVVCVEAAKGWLVAQLRVTKEWATAALRSDEAATAGWFDAMQMVRGRRFAEALEAFRVALAALDPEVHWGRCGLVHVFAVAEQVQGVLTGTPPTWQ